MMDTQTTERPLEQGGSSEGGLSRQGEADAANRESLSRAYDAIQAREKAVEKAPIIEDGARAQAVGERLLREDEDYTEAGLPVFRPHGTVPSVRDSLAAAATRAEQREKAKEARRMPELGADVPLRERLEKSVAWSALRDQDKVAFKRGHTEAAEQKRAAEWFGMTPEQAKLVEIQAQLKGQDRVRPVLDRYAKLVPGQHPEATMANAAAWAEALRRNPEQAYRQLGERLGIQGPGDLQRQQQAQYQQQLQVQRQQQQQQRVQAAVVRAVSTAVDSFAQSHPDVDALQPRIIHTLGSMRRSGNAMADLKSAYRMAGGRYAV